MEIFREIEQGTPEWIAVRMGIPTASEFSTVMQQIGPRGGIPKGRQTYMRKLAGEIITGEPMEYWSNAHMERGKDREDEARRLYAMVREVEPEQVGFIRNGNCGASPDALVSNDGMFENKDALAHIQIERLEDNALPSEHVAQCQGGLMVAEREWIDFQSYCRGLPPLVVRVYRDENYINALRAGVARFVDELNELVEKVRGM